MKDEKKRGASALRIATVFLLCGLVLVAIPLPGNAEERTVHGTITRLDPVTKSFSIRDGKGVVWNYIIGKDSGVDLEQFRIGDYVTVTLARATPLNMSTPADMLRKGDSVVRFLGK
jgi:hypothetical protein